MGRTYKGKFSFTNGSTVEYSDSEDELFVPDGTPSDSERSSCDADTDVPEEDPEAHLAALRAMSALLRMKRTVRRTELKLRRQREQVSRLSAKVSRLANIAEGRVHPRSASSSTRSVRVRKTLF